jgi:DNA-binding transcriptional LysR family regulator
MQLKQLHYLVAVADAGSFSAGARRAFVTQPTLSAAIAALETELGRKLFERRARGIAPTGECTRILEHARHVLREIESMKSVAERASSRRPVRIGVLPSAPSSLLGEIFAKLKQLDPDRNWRVEEAPLAKLRQRLASGRYDAIFTNLRDKVERSYAQFEFTRDQQVLAFPKERAPAGRITPKILQRRPIIVRTHCEFLQRASRILDEWQVRPLVVARTDNDARALSMVAAGLGACLVPDSLSDEKVRLVPVDGVDLKRRLGLEWIKNAANGLLDLAIKRL